MEASPSHFNGQPSDGLVGLIAALETADPNAPCLSEDESNSNWGHRQLSGTWRGVLISWESVGTCEVACRLMAAVVKTCKVARHFCFIRNLDASSFLSDAYLEQIVETLWEYWKAAGGVSGFPNRSDITDTYISKPLVKGKAMERPSTEKINQSASNTSNSVNNNEERSGETEEVNGEGNEEAPPLDNTHQCEVKKLLSVRSGM